MGIAISEREKIISEFFTVNHDLEPILVAILKKEFGVFTIEIQPLRIDCQIDHGKRSIFIVSKGQYSFQRSFALLEELNESLERETDYLDYLCERLVSKYNTSEPITKIENLKLKLNEIEQIYLGDLDLIEERGILIRDMMVKTDTLKGESGNYLQKAKKMSRKVGRPFYVKKRFWFLIGVLFVIIVFGLLFIFLGFK